MKRVILPFVFLCGLVLSCNNSQNKQNSADNSNGDSSLASNSDSIKPELHVCTELPLATNDTSKNGVRKASSLKYLNWSRNTDVLNVAFLDGDPVVQEKVKNVAKKWEDYCGIQFNFNSSSKPDITISFKYSGSWSCIGKSSLRQSPSMNFGWLTRNTDATEYDRVVLHEFGHALGLIHEHQNPEGNPIQWNKSAVYQYYMGPPNNWSKDEIDENIFAKYDESELNGTVFDPQSIMLYSIPENFTIDHYSIGWNTELSELDKTLIGQLYPKRQ